MFQRAFDPTEHPPSDPLHLAIIMDGNGRWAEHRGLPRSAGHQAGARAVRRTVRAAAERGIGTLTLYAFSSDNWRRPPEEVRHLMKLLERHLAREAAPCTRDGIRVSVIGRRDRLDPRLVAAIEAAEEATRNGTRMHLQLAVDYSARDALVEAARTTPPGAPSRAAARTAFGGALARALHADAAVPDVDLLVRTGGERRLSDFLLWECAYAELHFTPTPWPDFGARELDQALADFHARTRRFGALPGSAPSSVAHRVREARMHA
jgi:undecaprenyl diphosphate synthase